MYKPEKHAGYLDVNDIADELGICYSLARVEVMTKMNYVLIGRRRFVSREEFRKYLERQTVINHKE